ncbi:hypothetical protein AG1IA_03790 [Rhizoctonia solani AG-1 IA]|uniref:Uncharacterized protein n=1 Tax=Thanatephorus cucumeris (strain AG1-IA) TaxID=983506 RepID=L8WZH6_THACA|nr:hypothetical protein AG1IA_03790 [Rhizoctonia solani AG-1 IA]
MSKLTTLEPVGILRFAPVHIRHPVTMVQTTTLYWAMLSYVSETYMRSITMAILSRPSLVSILPVHLFDFFLLRMLLPRVKNSSKPGPRACKDCHLNSI